MTYDPKKHNRRSIRLKNYDYSSDGAYFITFVTKNREDFFGEIINGEMILNNFGKIIEEEWNKTEEIRDNIILDEFVVMPNHIHGIIFIDNFFNSNNEGGGGRMQYAPTQYILTDTPTDFSTKEKTAFISPKNNLGSIVRGLKSAMTKKYWEKMSQLEYGGEGRMQYTTTNITFKESIWQRNYYENIIRNERALNNIRRYIKENPMKWFLDRENKNGEFEKYKFNSMKEINDFEIKKEKEV